MLKAIFLISCLCLLAVMPSHGQTAMDSVEVSSEYAEDHNIEFEDDFSPGLLFFFLIFLGCSLIVIGAGVVIAGFAAAILLGMLSLGIVGTSVLAGWRKKSIDTGFRTAIYGFSIAGGLIFGLIVGWALTLIWKEMEMIISLSVAGLAGVLSGILLGFLIVKIYNIGSQYLKDKFQKPTIQDRL